VGVLADRLEAVSSRLIRGDSRKKTRLHDFAGNLVPPAAFASLPRCVLSTLLLKTLGVQSRQPWISYRAIRRLGRLVRPSWRVLEFGSGASSRWFASRCSFLVTLESDPEWFSVVTSTLADFENVDLRFVAPPYAPALADLDPTFDFALVDGLARDKAMKVALEKVKPGGYIYLDNADVQDAEHQAALGHLLAAADDRQPAERFLDFAPCRISVSQGVLARIGTRPPPEGSP